MSGGKSRKYSIFAFHIIVSCCSPAASAISPEHEPCGSIRENHKITTRNFPLVLPNTQGDVQFPRAA